MLKKSSILLFPWRREYWRRTDWRKHKYLRQNRLQYRSERKMKIFLSLKRRKTFVEIDFDRKHRRSVSRPSWNFFEETKFRFVFRNVANVRRGVVNFLEEKFELNEFDFSFASVLLSPIRIVAPNSLNNSERNSSNSIWRKKNLCVFREKIKPIFFTLEFLLFDRLWTIVPLKRRLCRRPICEDPTNSFLVLGKNEPSSRNFYLRLE